VRERPELRAVVPFALACGAVLGALSLGGALWLLVPLAAVFVAAPLRAVAASLLAAVLALPALLAAPEFLRADNTTSFREDSELGNLVEPLSWLQALGVWPAGDFRVDPAQMTATRALLAVVALALVGGATYAAQRRLHGLLVLLGTGAVGAGVLTLAGSPWVASKALAVASPALLLGAVAAAAVLALRWLPAGVALLAAIAFGVVWSNALAYRHANLAPRDRLAELEQIGERFAGAGPALLTDYEVYGARHFLRDLAPESASELRRRFVYLRDGTSYLEKGNSADIDAFQLESVLEYNVLVLRRGPATSRPPLPYALAQEGRWYTVWLKTSNDPQVLAHVALGDNDNSAGPLPCTESQRLASVPGVISLAVTPGVEAVPLEPGGVEQRRIVYAGAAVPAGRYDVFLGGSFRGTIEARIGGATLHARHSLNWPGLYTPLGSVDLPAGPVTASLEPGGSDLRPGEGGPAETFGPLVVAPEREWRVRSFPPSGWREACAREWDWIEAATVAVADRG
jgi:hypothetical protein